MSWLRNWGPAILWAAAIWLFSTDWLSADATSRFLLPLLRRLLPGADPATLELLHAALRKAGHVAEYFVLSLLMLRGVRGGAAGWKPAWGLAALGLSVAYAAVDELHQSFVPGRRGALADVLLYDSAGALAAQLWTAWRGRRAQFRLEDRGGTG
jgi:VanZ family protein